MTVMPDLHPVAHIISDPPYEEEAHTLQRRVKRSEGVSSEPLTFPALTEEQRNGLAQWAKVNCAYWLLVFCQAEAVATWRASLNEAGCSYKRAMVWVKPDGMPQYSGDRPGMGYESIVAAWCGKGRSRWYGGGRHGVFIGNKNDDAGKKAPHPTKKPRWLMAQLVELFTAHGETVLDPFMGSGSTGVACARLGRPFIGIEKDPAHFETACRRIEEAYRQADLFIAPPEPTEHQEIML